MSLGGGAPAILGAVVAKRRRELIAKFRAAGATSRDRARSAEELSVTPGSPLFRVQVGRGVLVEAEGGLYYLDEAAAERADRLRRWLLLAVLALAVALALLAIGS